MTGIRLLAMTGIRLLAMTGIKRPRRRRPYSKATDVMAKYPSSGT